MKRVAIFVCFDKHEIIHDYVISYLKHLKKVANRIILIADNSASDTEKQKIKDLVEYAEFIPHGEYDFGSYKRGFNHARNNGWLSDADELIFCNDSCFCTYDFEDTFKQMAKQECDFWGITESIMYDYHLQSYFLTFKKNVFLSQQFDKWINSITKQDNVKAVIQNYELTLTSFLQNLGFKSACLIKTTSDSNPTSRPLYLLKNKSPLIKKKVFLLREACLESPRNLLHFLKTNYLSCYKEICNYHITSAFYCFPLLMPRDLETIKRFFYQKKITKSGKLCIKICKR